ncbi:N-acetylmuramoyl-L-alanine amidase [Allostreptomyces psammosilenae]|uniref:N-acetylmuramoyl-L-alanine amidase n=1 Tax=Allostreptomyces psammosilenae TaxID=1892865 RepID=A0A853A1L4_9ACTN|nr:N-acetylmuramoyl-L-alanine amidase [Allostreptomyces psammosilenae]NYI06804.1 N-acetylmuramoyl-L-alanine amidase [Allostreptomyces psammosilenae]
MSRGNTGAAVAAAASALLVAVTLSGCGLLGRDAEGVPGGGGGPAVTSASPSPSAGAATGTAPAPTPSAAPTGDSTATPAPTPTAEVPPLAGRTVVIDPGHNPGNAAHPAEIAEQVDVGTGHKECDTVGAEDAAGNPEYAFTLDLARLVREELRERGADVVLTHDGDRPWGPCVDERARIGNEAGADAAVSLHADGGPATGRGFHVIAPGPVDAGTADNQKVVAPSRELAERLREAFGAATGMPVADYLAGGSGLDVRSDLGGLNLSQVPKVFLECGNMRNAEDAAALADPKWRRRAAAGVADALTAFLTTDRPGS